jgi:hypothetical protein
MTVTSTTGASPRSLAFHDRNFNDGASLDVESVVLIRMLRLHTREHHEI